MVNNSFHSCKCLRSIVEVIFFLISSYRPIHVINAVYDKPNSNIAGPKIGVSSTTLGPQEQLFVLVEILPCAWFRSTLDVLVGL